MLENIVEKKDKRNRRVSGLISVSLAAHLVVLAGVLLADQLRVPVVPDPAIAVTFVDFASAPPPPPPPPPPKKRTTPKKVEPKPEVKPVEKEFVAPKEIPKEEKPPEPEESAGEDTGSDEGVEGGVEGGVVGGVVGGVLGSVATPPPVAVKAPEVPRGPPPPVFQEASVVRKRRTKGSDPGYPRNLERLGTEGTVTAKISIGLNGEITSIQIQQSSHELFEKAVRSALAGWRFAPHIVDGRATPVYTLYRFVFRLQ